MIIIIIIIIIIIHKSERKKDFTPYEMPKVVKQFNIHS